jgi:hypothetical protein
VSGLKGNVESLRKFSKNLRALPKVVAQKVATQSAPPLTTDTHRTFSAGTDPYGVPWAPGADGQRVTLVLTGALEQALAYTSTGTIIRLQTLPRYAKYQLGKRRVAPAPGATLPPAFRTILSTAADSIIRAELAR